MSYTVKPILVLEMNKMRRDFAKLGFPYISYNGVEILRLGYTLRGLHRDSVVISIFDNQKSTRYSQVGSANKALAMLVEKGYLEIVAKPQQEGFLYALTDLAFEFLKEPSYKVNWDRNMIMKAYSVNRVFTDFCSKYRYDYVVEWDVNYEGKITAKGIVWDSDLKREKVSEHLFVWLENRFPNDQKRELQQLKEEYDNVDMNVYAVSLGEEDNLIPVVEKAG